MPKAPPSRLIVSSIGFIVFVAIAAGFAESPHLRVSVRGPAPASSVTRLVVWEVDVTGGAPKKVDFFVDGQLLWTERQSPYRFNGDNGSFSPADVRPGKHTLKAVAHGSGSTASATIVVFVPKATVGSRLPTRLGASTGKQYFVDGTSGKDSNRGTRKAPWKTIARAWAKATAGTTISVRGGAYAGQIKLTAKSASAGNPVTVRAFPGERVTIFNPTVGYPAVYFRNAKGVRFEGFDVRNPTGDGIKVDDSADIEITRNKIHGNGMQGILVGGDAGHSTNVQIWANRFYRNGGYSPTGDPYALRGTHSIYYGNTPSNSDGVKHGTVGGIIANNVFFDAPTGYHIQVGSQSDGLIITNNTFDNAFQANTAAGNAIQIYGEDNQFATKNTIVANNVIANSANRGIHGSGPTMHGNIVLYNLAFNNPLGNIVASTGSSTLFSVGAGNITNRNPRFVDRAARNYRPARGSPLIGRADPAHAPAFDAAGQERRGKPDIGAFEYTG